MRRREFIKYGSGLCVLGSAGGLGLAGTLARPARARSTVDFHLRVAEVIVELIDGSTVFMWAFDGGFERPRVPGPVLRVQQGDTVRITVQNATNTPHGFAIPGIPYSETPIIPPDGQAEVLFTADQPGSYLYLDPLNAPVNRALGLHGALVVEPEIGRTPSGKPMPYADGQATPAVRDLFDILGPPPPDLAAALAAAGLEHAYPGNPWVRGRDRIWIFNEIDPDFNEEAEAGKTIDADRFARRFTPRYFTLNGLSGFDAAHDDASRATGREGEPLIIRVLGAGLCTHAPHIHGNHVFELSGIDPDTQGVVVRDNPIERDTWIIAPLDRKDMLLPFRRPPDIPAAAWPPRQEPFPLRYPMHCHIEMSQTAAGGSYPQGLISDWEMEAPLARQSASIPGGSNG